MPGRTAAVTYEQVESVANALFAGGNKNPSAKAIREEMSKRASGVGEIGSMSTIQAFLTEWRKLARPIEPVAEPTLPTYLMADLARAMSKVASEAEARKQKQLEQLDDELAELVSAAQANEQRLEELTREVTARTTERDSMSGQLADRTAELDSLKLAQLDSQTLLATMDIDLNAARTDAKAANGRLEELRLSTEGLKMQVLADLEHARASQYEAAREAAESAKQNAALEARLEGEREAKRSQEQREAELQSKLKRFEDDTARAQVAEATCAGLREQNLVLQRTLKVYEALLENKGRQPDDAAGALTKPSLVS